MPWVLFPTQLQQASIGGDLQPESLPCPPRSMWALARCRGNYLDLIIDVWKVAVLSIWAEALVKTYNLNKIPIRHIPDITGRREERAFKKFILSSGHLEDNFRWNFDWIVSEYFSSFWERTFLSVQLQPPMSTWCSFENTRVCCYGNSSQVRLTWGPLLRPQEHTVSFYLVSFGLSRCRNSYFLGYLFFMARHWWIHGQREQIILSCLRCPSHSGRVDFWWVNPNKN